MGDYAFIVLRYYKYIMTRNNKYNTLRQRK
jgi:hypothetical protein